MEEFGETEKPRIGIVSPGEALPSVPVPGDKASGDFALTCLQAATLRPVPVLRFRSGCAIRPRPRCARGAGRDRQAGHAARAEAFLRHGAVEAGQDAPHAKACPGCGQSERRFSRYDCRRFVRGAAPNRPISAGFGDSSDLPREHLSVRICDWGVRVSGWMGRPGKRLRIIPVFSKVPVLTVR